MALTQRITPSINDLTADYCLGVTGITAFCSDLSTVTYTHLFPSSGELQAPPSSDSDTSIIMGVEMSEVDLSTEQECEGSKS